MRTEECTTTGKNLSCPICGMSDAVERDVRLKVYDCSCSRCSWVYSSTVGAARQRPQWAILRDVTPNRATVMEIVGSRQEGIEAMQDERGRYRRGYSAMNRVELVDNDVIKGLRIWRRV